MMNYDELWENGPRFLQSRGVFKLGTDSVLLAHFTDMTRVKTACDLGCGGGILTILLALKAENAKIHSIDIQTDAVRMTRENTDLNSLSERVTVFHGDLRHSQEFLASGGYDLVISNPPYFTQGSGKPAQTHTAARDERHCTLGELAQTASRLLRWGGKFTMVHRPERLSEIFCALSQHHIEPKRLRMVHHKSASPPNLVLIEGKRGGNPGLKADPPLVLCNDDGSDSPLLREIYRRE